jgi:hypothetical protein
MSAIVEILPMVMFKRVVGGEVERGSRKGDEVVVGVKRPTNESLQLVGGGRGGGW